MNRTVKIVDPWISAQVPGGGIWFGKKSMLPKGHVEIVPPAPAVSVRVLPKRRDKGDPRRDARRRQLQDLANAGAIRDLQENVDFVLIPREIRNGRVLARAYVYTAPFVYKESRHDNDDQWRMYTVVEETRAYRDEAYRIKRQLMLRVHNIVIREL